MAQVEPSAVIAEGERSRANDVNNRYPGTHHCLFFSTPLALGGLSSRDWVMCEAWRHSLFRCIILETMLAYSITLYACNPLQLWLSRLTLWNGSWTSVDYVWRRNFKTRCTNIEVLGSKCSRDLSTCFRLPLLRCIVLLNTERPACCDGSVLVGLNWSDWGNTERSTSQETYYTSHDDWRKAGLVCIPAESSVLG